MIPLLRVGFWLVDESQGLVRRRQKTEEETTRLVRERAEEVRQEVGSKVARADEAPEARHH